MTKSVLVLKNLTEIKLEEGASLGNMCAIFADRQEMVDVWEKLTVDNLKKVQILTGETVSGEYKDLILDSETSIIKTDGYIRTSFAIRKKTETELLREMVDKVVNSQELQDGAIAELAAITSTVVEKVEGGTQ